MNWQTQAILISIIFWTVFFGVVWLMSGEKNKKNENEGVFLSTEGMNAKDKLVSSFEKLAREILFYDLRETMKMRKVKKEIGVGEDAKNAFLKAIEEVYLAN